MAISRRRIWGSLLVAPAAQAQSQARDLEAIRQVAGAHGIPLTDDRCRILQPVLERRQAQLEVLRRFALDDTIEPTQGILRK